MGIVIKFPDERIAGGERSERGASATIVILPVVRIERNRGNGAREALIDVGELLPNTSTEDAARWADWLLAEFWARGFKVVPVE